MISKPNPWSHSPLWKQCLFWCMLLWCGVAPANTSLQMKSCSCIALPKASTVCSVYPWASVTRGLPPLEPRSFASSLATPLMWNHSGPEWLESSDKDGWWSSGKEQLQPRILSRGMIPGDCQASLWFKNLLCQVLPFLKINYVHLKNWHFSKLSTKSWSFHEKYLINSFPTRGFSDFQNENWSNDNEQYVIQYKSFSWFPAFSGLV